MADTRTRKQLNRAIRQEELRKQLSAGKHVEKAAEILNKMSHAKTKFALDKLKAAFDGHMRLVRKYLPDLQSTELTGPDGDKLFPDSITVKHE